MRPHNKLMSQLKKESKHAQVDLVVWGDYACFTRPEFKSERESYPVITPSAARGILEAIYWKPQMRYRILEIHIHSLGRRFSLLRNELASRQSSKSGDHRILIDENRQQRTSLILKDVAYRIRAWIDVRADEPSERIGKHLDSFRRRAETGACHHQPCLGCREFPAQFAPYGEPEIPKKISERNKELNDHFDFGTMLFDTAYITKGSHHQHKKEEMTFYHHRNRRRFKMAGHAERLFFHAQMNEGILRIPQDKYNEIAKLEGKQWDSIRH